MDKNMDMHEYYNNIAKELDNIGNKNFAVWYLLQDIIDELETTERTQIEKGRDDVKTYCYVKKLGEQVKSLKELREMLAYNLF